MKKISLLYVLFTAVVFAAMEPASKLLAGQIGALSLTFLRFLVGSALLLPVALVTLRKRRIRLTRRDALALAVEGVLCVCVSMGLLQLAVFKAQSAALVAVIFCSNSVLTVLFAAWLLGERLTRPRVAALALCMAGVAIGGGAAQGESLEAVLYAVLSAVAMSLFTVLGKKTMRRIPPEAQVGLSFSIGTAALGLALLLAREPLWPAAMDARGACVVLFLGVAVTGLGYLSYFKAMEKAGAFMASLVFFIKPLLAPLMSLLLLGTASAGPTLMVSIALVLAGSALMLYERRQAAPTGKEAAKQ